jgi:hypothetical protein
MTDGTAVFEWWGKAMEASIPFWKNWGTLSESQREILNNYRGPFREEYEKFLQLAPKSLQQSINPWSFSLIQFADQIKGDPVTEVKILTEVAGYGSQLGTILDFLCVLEKNCGLEMKKLKDMKEMEAVKRFHDLVEQVNQVKQSAALPQSKA